MATKKRETSDRVSKIAARILRICRMPLYSSNCTAAYTSDSEGNVTEVITMRDLRALAGSCLAQDTTKGKRPAKRKAKRR